MSRTLRKIFTFPLHTSTRYSHWLTEHVVWWCVRADTSDPNVRFTRSAWGSRLDTEKLSGAMDFRYVRGGGQRGFRLWGARGRTLSQHSDQTQRAWAGNQCESSPGLGTACFGGLQGLQIQREVGSPGSGRLQPAAQVPNRKPKTKPNALQHSPVLATGFWLMRQETPRRLRRPPAGRGFQTAFEELGFSRVAL